MRILGVAICVALVLAAVAVEAGGRAALLPYATGPARLPGRRLQQYAGYPGSQNLPLAERLQCGYEGGRGGPPQYGLVTAAGSCASFTVTTARGPPTFDCSVPGGGKCGADVAFNVTVQPQYQYSYSAAPQPAAPGNYTVYSVAVCPGAFAEPGNLLVAVRGNDGSDLGICPTTVVEGPPIMDCPAGFVNLSTCFNVTAQSKRTPITFECSYGYQGLACAPGPWPASSTRLPSGNTLAQASFCPAPSGYTVALSYRDLPAAYDLACAGAPTCRVAGTPQDVAAACDKNADCQAFTYTANSNAGYLKGGGVNLARATTSVETYVFANPARLAAPAAPAPAPGAGVSASYAAYANRNIPSSGDYACAGSTMPGFCEILGSPAAVQRACDQDVRCQGFVYINGYNKGYLKTGALSAAQAQPDSATTLYLKTSAGGAPAPSAGSQPGTYTALPGQNIPSTGDYSCAGTLTPDFCNLAGSPQDLQAACDKDSQCQGFVYINGAAMGYLKTGALSASQAQPDSATTLYLKTSAGGAPAPSAGSQAGTYTALPGQNIPSTGDYSCAGTLTPNFCNLAGSPQDLQAACDKDSQCQGFVYINGAAMGYLKTGALSAAQAQPDSATTLYIKQASAAPRRLLADQMAAGLPTVTDLVVTIKARAGGGSSNAGDRATGYCSLSQAPGTEQFDCGAFYSGISAQGGSCNSFTLTTGKAPLSWTCTKAGGGACSPDLVINQTTYQAFPNGFARVGINVCPQASVAPANVTIAVTGAGGTALGSCPVALYMPVPLLTCPANLTTPDACFNVTGVGRAPLALACDGCQPANAAPVSTGGPDGATATSQSFCAQPATPSANSPGGGGYPGSVTVRASGPGVQYPTSCFIQTPPTQEVFSCGYTAPGQAPSGVTIAAGAPYCTSASLTTAKGPVTLSCTGADGQVCGAGVVVNQTVLSTWGNGFVQSQIDVCVTDALHPLGRLSVAVAGAAGAALGTCPVTVTAGGPALQCPASARSGECVVVSAKAAAPAISLTCAAVNAAWQNPYGANRTFDCPTSGAGSPPVASASATASATSSSSSSSSSSTGGGGTVASSQSAVSRTFCVPPGVWQLQVQASAATASSGYAPISQCTINVLPLPLPQEAAPPAAPAGSGGLLPAGATGVAPATASQG